MSDFNVFYYVTKSEIFKQNCERVNISKPRILDIMLQENDELVVPKSLKYFRQPKPLAFPLDLNLGYEDYKMRNKEYFHSSPRKFEKYLMENNGRSLLKETSKQKFCVQRNVLKYLMMTPYRIFPSDWHKWTINVIKFQDVIYMARDKEGPRPKNKVYTYHFKLHQYCFSDSPYKEPETDEPIDENTQMSCIYRIDIDDFELFYSAEIVGVESINEIENFKNEDTLNNCQFVMTKLLPAKSVRSELTKHPKLFGAWIQSYLTSVDTVYVGIRTENGFVNRKLEKLKTQDIPKYQIWNPEVCKRFMRDFLDKVQKKMANVDCPHTVYQFSFDPNMKMIKYRVYEGKTEHSFLSGEFIEYMQKK